MTQLIEWLGTLGQRFFQNFTSIEMKQLKKVFFATTLCIGLAFFLTPSQVDAACDNAYDVTYPSRFCDPQGFGSCARLCPGDQ